MQGFTGGVLIPTPSRSSSPAMSDQRDHDLGVTMLGRFQCNEFFMCALPNSATDASRRRSCLVGAGNYQLGSRLQMPARAISIQITFQGCQSSDVVWNRQERIRAAGDTGLSIASGRVMVIGPSDRHRHSEGFWIHIVLTAPPNENVVVSHSPSRGGCHELAEAAVKDASAAVLRQVNALRSRLSRERAGAGRFSRLAKYASEILLPERRLSNFRTCQNSTTATTVGLQSKR